MYFKEFYLIKNKLQIHLLIINKITKTNHTLGIEINFNCNFVLSQSSLSDRLLKSLQHIRDWNQFRRLNTYIMAIVIIVNSSYYHFKRINNQ